MENNSFMSPNRKDVIPQKHQEIHIGFTVFPVGNDEDPAKAFLARRPSKRAMPHFKINECDH
jgi:hypothetical protein